MFVTSQAQYVFDNLFFIFGKVQSPPLLTI